MKEKKNLEKLVFVFEIYYYYFFNFLVKHEHKLISPNKFG